MLKKMNVTVPSEYLELARDQLPEVDGRLTLNLPTGDFFYDPWEIKPEFKSSVWEKLLETLPIRVGEARLINLGIETCYTKHADIDNRCHYSLSNENAFLIDIDKQEMHSLDNGVWYYMDAGRNHSAANFGCDPRISLVVRERLHRCTLIEPKCVIIVIDTAVYNYRFLFDKYYSGLLNHWQNERLLTDFFIDSNMIHFKLDKNVEIPRYLGFEIYEYD